MAAGAQAMESAGRAPSVAEICHSLDVSMLHLAPAAVLGERPLTLADLRQAADREADERSREGDFWAAVRSNKPFMDAVDLLDGNLERLAEGYGLDHVLLSSFPLGAARAEWIGGRRWQSFRDGPLALVLPVFEISGWDHRHLVDLLAIDSVGGTYSLTGLGTGGAICGGCRLVNAWPNPGADVVVYTDPLRWVRAWPAAVDHAARIAGNAHAKQMEPGSHGLLILDPDNQPWELWLQGARSAVFDDGAVAQEVQAQLRRGRAKRSRPEVRVMKPSFAKAAEGAGA